MKQQSQQMVKIKLSKHLQRTFYNTDVKLSLQYYYFQKIQLQINQFGQMMNNNFSFVQHLSVQKKLNFCKKQELKHTFSRSKIGKNIKEEFQTTSRDFSQNLIILSKSSPLSRFPVKLKSVEKWPKEGFKILSSRSKKSQQFYNFKCRLQFSSPPNSLKCKTDSQWTKKVSKQKKYTKHHKNISSFEQKLHYQNIFNNPTTLAFQKPKNIHNTITKNIGIQNSLKQDINFFNTIQKVRSNNPKANNKVQLKNTIIEEKYSVDQNECQRSVYKTLNKKGDCFDKDMVKNYQKGKLLGKGYFGEVYLGLHRPTGMLCALKYLNLDRLIKQDMLLSIRRQIECQIILSHPNICKIYQYYIDKNEKSLVLVIEFVEGEQLYKIITNRCRYNQQDTADLIFQTTSALQHMHRKHVIHRDIKPQNIMISNGVVKVCDFGLAIITTCLRSTVCGTPLYSSPEIILKKEYDKRIDLWALGVLTYQMLIGNVPFKIYGEHQLNKIAQDKVVFPEYVEISSKAKDFIERILKKDPEERMSIIQILNHPFISRRKRLIQRVSDTYPEFLNVVLDTFLPDFS